MNRAVLAAIAAVLVSSCADSTTSRSRGAHWNDKATLSVRDAERRVGGFNAEERKSYRGGAQHILNQREKIGTFTIAQVIDQERSRSKTRAAVAIAVRQRRTEAAARVRIAEQNAPKVSSYAKNVALMFQLDIVSYREMADAARAYNMTRVYGTAQRTLEGVRMIDGLSSKKPEGFDRTERAVEEYLADMKHRYEAAAEMANDPSPKHNYEFAEAHGSDYGTHYAGAVLSAFDADLREAGYTGSLRERLRSRIRGG